MRLPGFAIPSILVLSALAIAAPTPAAARVQATSGGAWPTTRAERTNYAETSRYDEVVAFMRNVAERSPRIHLTSFGFTNEGRSLPLAVVGDVADATPEAVRDSGRLRVYLQGNIHAGEVCGKEALLMLLRDLARGEHTDWTDSAVLLIAPIYNADGNERFALTNRPAQNGPIGGMGQRPNAQGLDLNRDHIKAESPEARSLLALMNDYDPHLGVDLHTTNGTHHAYHLTYAPPLHPATHPAIDSLLRDEWLPAVTTSIRERHGQETYHYGNVPRAGAVERGWYTFDHRPRFSNNYLGLRNRFAILGEAYAYASFEDRVLASLYFTRAILDFAGANAERITTAVERADTEPVVGTELAVRSTFRRSEAPVEILMGEVAPERHPYTGRTLLRRLDTRLPETMPEFVAFAADETERAPEAYLVPADLEAVLDLLEAHGVSMHALDADEEMEIERFRIRATSVASRPFQGHQERTLEGVWEAVTATIPAGTWRVELNQPLGRLAFTLLEPRSDDGLANWNFLDGAIEEAETYPIVRLPAPADPVAR